MKKVFLILGLLCLAPAGQADPLNRFLDLDPEQRFEIELRRAQLGRSLAPLAVQLRAREALLREELALEAPDPLRAGRLAIEISRIRARASVIAAEARTHAVDLLDAEQQERLDPLRVAAKLAPAARQAVELNLIGRGDPLPVEP